MPAGSVVCDESVRQAIERAVDAQGRVTRADFVKLKMNYLEETARREWNINAPPREGTPGEMVESAKSAVMRWGFSPATLDGKPVASYRNVNVRFFAWADEKIFPPVLITRVEPEAPDVVKNWRYYGVVNMMAAPRQGVKHFSIFPGDGEW